MACLHVSRIVSVAHIALFIFVIRCLVVPLAWFRDSHYGCGILLCGALLKSTCAIQSLPTVDCRAAWCFQSFSWAHRS